MIIAMWNPPPFLENNVLRDAEPSMVIYELEIESAIYFD